jgi:hypothetical protein
MISLLLKRLDLRIEIIKGGNGMKKVQWPIISCLVVLLFLTAFYLNKRHANSAIELKATAGSDHSTSVVKSRIVETLNDQDSDLFQSIINDSTIIVPYAKLGETVHLKLKDDKEASSYELKEIILNKNGTFKYDSKLDRAVYINFINGSTSFNLSANTSSMLSSNTEDYKPGASLRGYRFVCKWENQIQEYAFIIRTDSVIE